MDRETVQPLYEALHRYAGWLDRDRASVTVRADVKALGIALDASVDPTLLLQTLDADLARLPSGDLRRLLRAAAKRLHGAFSDPPFSAAPPTRS